MDIKRLHAHEASTFQVKSLKCFNCCRVSKVFGNRTTRPSWSFFTGQIFVMPPCRAFYLEKMSNVNLNIFLINLIIIYH